MSFHNKPDYHIPELIEALKAHRLPHDTPSQLADGFRIGWMACRELAQADSVQEDAADPLQGAANWLAEAHGQFSPVVLSGCLMIGYNRAKRLHDAALAARKQGEKQ